MAKISARGAHELASWRQDGETVERYGSVETSYVRIVVCSDGRLLSGHFHRTKSQHCGSWGGGSLSLRGKLRADIIAAGRDEMIAAAQRIVDRRWPDAYRVTAQGRRMAVTA